MVAREMCGLLHIAAELWRPVPKGTAVGWLRTAAEAVRASPSRYTSGVRAGEGDDPGSSKERPRSR